MKKLTVDAYHEVAAKRGFKWIGQDNPLTNVNTKWECSQGHTWEATYTDIRMGNGCPVCSQRIKKTASDYVELARQRGFFWVDTLPQHSHLKTRWQCQHGHVWEATYTNISNRKSNCPHCKEYVNGQPVSQRQRGIHRMIGGQLNYPVNRYRIDIAIQHDGSMIAVEYDSYHFHNDQRDAIRDRYLLSQGWRILRIKSGRLLPKKKDLLAALSAVKHGQTYHEIVLPDWGQD